MTWIDRRIGLPVHSRGWLAVFLISGLSLTLAWPFPARAAKLDRFLTAQDVAGRMMLDQNGQRIQLPTAGDRHPDLPKGSTPTYLAIPLHGSEHFPGSIPVLETGSQQGENPVGPLNFDTFVKASLDTSLNTARLAIVDTPTQNYLVEFLPRRARSSSSLEKAARTATNAANDLSHLLNTGSTQFTKLTQNSMTELEKFLHVSSKTSTLTPSLNLEAQVLSGEVVPAAIPEPSTWIIFAGLITGVAVLRKSAYQAVCN